MFQGAAAQPASQNKLVQIGVVGMAKDKNAYDKPSMDAAKKLRKDAKPLVADTDLRLGFTGPAAQALDSQEASANAEAIVGIATVLLILLLLILIFRSVIIAVMPIIVIGLVSQVAVGLVGAGQQDLRPEDRLLDPGDPDRGALRDRHRLHLVLPVPLPRAPARGEESRRRSPHAVERAGEAIASAGGAVIVSFMALILSSLGIFKSIGPALAIAVSVTVLAALTLVPAVVALLGTQVFWPSKSWKKEPEAARFAAIGNSLGRHPVRVRRRVRRCCSPSSRCSPSGSTPPSTSATPAHRRRGVLGRAEDAAEGPAGGGDRPDPVLLTSDGRPPLDKADQASYAKALGEAKGVAQVAPAGAEHGRQHRHCSTSTWTTTRRRTRRWPT